MTGSLSGGDDRRRVGQRGEQIAAEHLASLGYELLERNYRVAEGEVDLVARHGDTLVFVEVRSRRGRTMGLPEESVTSRKQGRLARVAQSYLQERGLAAVPWRIDVVAVEFDHRGRARRVEVLRNAVEGASADAGG